LAFQSDKQKPPQNTSKFAQKVNNKKDFYVQAKNVIINLYYQKEN
jgi:hypothetical protein